MNPVIVLASASPRRRELLSQIGICHQVCPVDIDETPRLNEDPACYAQRLAAEKSAACAERFGLALPILAADTAVVLGTSILGKPRDKEDAITMLRLLSGQTHQVFTAVSLRGKTHAVALSVTEVTFKSLSDSEIETYWHSGEPLDKAGAYAIQGKAGLFVEAIRGSFSGVVGLPLFETGQLLVEQGIL